LLIVLGLRAAGGFFSGGNFWSNFLFLAIPLSNFLLLGIAIWQLVDQAKRLNVDHKTRNVVVIIFLAIYFLYSSPLRNIPLNLWHWFIKRQ